MNIDGKKLQQLRKKAGLSQDALADGICSSSLISKIERGQANGSSKFPNLLADLAAKLDVPESELIVEEEVVAVTPVVELPAPASAEVAQQEPDFELDISQPLEEMIAAAIRHNRSTHQKQLGRNERNAWLFVNGFVHKIDHILEEFKERAHNYDPLMIELMEKGMRYVAKAMALRLSQCEAKTVQQLVRESYLLDVALAHRNRNDAQRYYNKFYEEDRALRRQAVEELGGDPISDLAEITLLNSCQSCNGMKRERGCSVFTAMQGLNIPEWEPDHPLCPYAGTGVVNLADTA
ncbi:helix-turn-helix transcriptional regulator [Tumebacillus sp. ITR2]|uniref:Helix-turn-helix transcriptional regulator n=1 Tax=Tumebacillus amylolyticus TaxID=2801339 RepID=A0ABS1JC61_9BACL|nr:helix-turn-helix domain-containing protein [Tumebacillus amylolyticus]MBL0387864.1 helix-turn-helix transcriptional regulator [Tumebacillus amylolyticus]